MVVARKVSGGSRSAEGGQTRMGLASLFGTWLARGQNSFEECQTLLSQKSALPPFTPILASEKICSLC